MNSVVVNNAGQDVASPAPCHPGRGGRKGFFLFLPPEAVFWAGLAPRPSCWAGLMGCGHVMSFLFFSYLVSFSFSSIFCFGFF
jgi:hypothetical protein